MEIYIPQLPGGGGGEQQDPDAYTVQPGDTLESIASQFGLELAELISANFSDGTLGQLSAGQELQIPQGDNVAGFSLYTVQEGDTTDKLAAQFQLGLTDLLRANPKLNQAPLLPGSDLRIPELKTKESAPSHARPETYTMKLGDTLKELAKQHQVSEQQLQAANPHIANTNKSYPGAVIKLPQSQESDNPSTSRSANALAIDNLSKIRFQMMESRPDQPNPIPGFGTPPPILNEQEEEEPSARRKLSNIPIPTPFDKWAPFIYDAAEKYRLEASLIAAIIWCESGGNNIIAKQGHGCGLMQIDDRYYRAWLDKNAQGLDPASNIDFGSSILRTHLDYFQGSIKAALAAYHAGREQVARALAGNRTVDNSTPGSRYAFDVLVQQDYFKRYFED